MNVYDDTKSGVLNLVNSLVSVQAQNSNIQRLQAFAGGQGFEEIDIGQHQTGLMECADHVFAQEKASDYFRLKVVSSLFS